MRFGLYLVLIITKNDSKRPDFSRSQLALFCEIQAFIRHRQNLQKVKTSFQFPYGSLLRRLGNSEISRFPSFLFLPILELVRYLSATAHFGSGLFVLSCCILRKKTERSVHRLSHFCLCSLEHMRINVQCSPFAK